MPRISRRNALKGFAFTIPAAWTAPVVQSVSLPAHGQMSPTDPPAPGAETDTIAGREFTCEDPLFCTTYLYELVGGRLVRDEVTCGGFPVSTPPINGFTVVFEVGRTTPVDVRMDLDVISNLGVGPHVEQVCEGQVFVPDATSQNQIEFTVDGIIHVVRFSLSIRESPPALLIGDITVAPL